MCDRPYGKQHPLKNRVHAGHDDERLRGEHWEIRSGFLEDRSGPSGRNPPRLKSLRPTMAHAKCLLHAPAGGGAPQAGASRGHPPQALAFTVDTHL